MRRDSVLSDIEKESIHIEKLIFHIILKDAEDPIFLDEVILNEDQIEFFRQRLIDASEGSQYLFKSDSTSLVYEECTKLVEQSENFLSASRQLTSNFKDHHKKTMSDGVFVVAHVIIDSERDMVFLVKLDHKLVYRYKLNGSTATLEEIKNTFLEDKKAIQKVALIDMADHYSWDLLALERDIEGIREYFKSFLHVVEKDDAYSLTEKAMKIAMNWASNEPELINEEDDPSSYKHRAIKYLLGHDSFNSEEFIDYVIFDTKAEKRVRAKDSFKNYMEQKGLYGQAFKPSHNALSPRKRKNVYKTAEGLTLNWEGDSKDVNMQIPPKKDPNDNLYHIIIKTSEIAHEK